MGEGSLVMLVSINSLGGNSRDFCGKLMALGTRAVLSQGLPGSSSHRNGTEAEVWSGGVSVPDLSGDCKCACGFGISSSLGGVKIGSSSASDAMSLVYTLSQNASISSKSAPYEEVVCALRDLAFVLGRQQGKETRSL